MSQVAVKICGINDAAAFDAAAAAGANYIGFVFFPPSPRNVTPAEAAILSARCSGGPLRVGLFVDPTIEDIAKVLGEVALDVLQIYGGLAIAEVRTRFGLPVWKNISIAASADLPSDAAGADALVLEAVPPSGATRPGGNAAHFDWSLLRDWSAPAPWVLAGGLTPTNVAGAIRTTRAPAVDVSSGVETVRGLKDPALIRAFIERARSVSEV